mgnify:CR=1 FL=1
MRTESKEVLAMVVSRLHPKDAPKTKEAYMETLQRVKKEYDVCCKTPDPIIVGYILKQDSLVSDLLVML